MGILDDFSFDFDEDSEWRKEQEREQEIASRPHIKLNKKPVKMSIFP